MEQGTLYWIWLSLAFEAGNNAFLEVLSRLGSAQQAYLARPEVLDATFSDRPEIAARLANKDLSRAADILAYCERNHIRIYTYADMEYPARLKMIKDPPALLYCAGKLPNFDRRLAVAVVGTRKMSLYGRKMSYRIAYELAGAGAIVVSGMALGCDGVAAGAAMAAGGDTVAVLGCGIDVVYPAQHNRLMGHIIERGAVITEYPPGTPPRGFHFPVRNRILSGLSQGVLAVEGSAKSGSMLTVRHATVQGRKIFAVPGNADSPVSEGTNALIRDGARVVLEGSDILDAFRVTCKEFLSERGYQEARKHSHLDENALAYFGVAGAFVKPSDALETQPAEKAPPLFRASEEKEETAEKKEKKPPKKRAAKAEKQRPEEDMGTQAPPKSMENSSSAQEARTEQSEKQGRKQSEGPDGSEAALAALSARDRRVFAEMPYDRAVTLDEIMTYGIRPGDAMISVTILELQGLIESLPGGLYLKK